MPRWLLLFALTTACGGTASKGEWDANRVERNYQDAYQDWTRHGQAYEYFEGRAFVHATMFSPEFAEAFARYESQRLGHVRSEAEANAERHLIAARSETKLVVTLVTQNPYWDDLSRKDATFRVVMVQGQTTIQPTSIVKVSVNIKEDLGQYFEHIDPIGSAYWVTFPLVAEPGVLRIAGPPARIDLVWND